LLFAYSVGACASPLLASAAMTALDTPFGLFGFWCLTHTVFAGLIVTFKAREKVAHVAVADQVAFVPMKTTSPVVMALDPRNAPPHEVRRGVPQPAPDPSPAVPLPVRANGPSPS
jgi:hypothetical protein